MPPGHGLADREYVDAKTLWDFHHLHHEPRPTDVGIGMGSHDLGVATHTVNLYHEGMFPLIVFTGANAPTTIDRSHAAKPSTTANTPSNSASPTTPSSSKPTPAAPSTTSP